MEHKVIKEECRQDIKELTKKQSKEKEALNKMIKVSIVCTIFMIAEAVGGYVAGSLAIMTDAAHLFSDLSSFMISIFSIWIGQKKANRKCTFGYQRAEVLGALTSVVVIWILTVFLIKEAIERIYNPTEIVAKYMLITALFGLACNLVMIKVLHSGGMGGHHNCSHGHGHGNAVNVSIKEIENEKSTHDHHDHDKFHSDKCSHVSTNLSNELLKNTSIIEIEGEKDDLILETKTQVRDRKNTNNHKPHTKKSHSHHSRTKCNNHKKDKKDHHHDHEHNHNHNHDHNHDHHHDHDHTHDHHGHDNNHDHHEENVNVTAAIIHIIGDIIQSVGVVIAAIIIYIDQNYHIADPICTFIFSIIVLFTTVSITRKCINILMEATPDNINTDEIQVALKEKYCEIIRINDLHIWSISSGKIRAIIHIVTEDNTLVSKIKSFLKKKYKIEKTSVEIEYPEECDD